MSVFTAKNINPPLVPEENIVYLCHCTVIWQDHLFIYWFFISSQDGQAPDGYYYNADNMQGLKVEFPWTFLHFDKI